MLNKDRKILLKYLKDEGLKKKVQNNNCGNVDLIAILKEIGTIFNEQSSQLDDKQALDMVRLSDACANITKEYCLRYAQI